MEKPLLHKSIVLSHRQCPKRAWLTASGAHPVFSPHCAAMQQQGEVVHAAARAQFPTAPTISSRLRLRDAALATASALSEGAHVVMEAAFVGGAMGARVDILQRVDDRFDLVEVKSGGSLKEDYLDDVALQVVCLSAAGVPLRRVIIQHPDISKTLADASRPNEVFVRDDVTDMVAARLTRVEPWIQDCAQTLAGPMPEATPGPQCDAPHECPFKYVCGKVVEDADPDRVEFLPSHAGEVKLCIARGAKRISELPASAFSHHRNALVRDALVANDRVIRKSAVDLVRGLPYPRYFADFEALAPPIPRAVGMRPYQPLVFQWSVHCLPFRGAELLHAEYLDEAGGDPRRAFIESLLASVGTSGPVLTYSAYERSRLSELATLFPDLAPSIQAVIARLVDLLPVARRGYYHPDQRGSWSIKRIQPTLPPDGSVGYDDLTGVADGMAAQAAYLALVTSTDESVRAQRRGELLAYCRTDTKELTRFCAVLEAA